MTLRDVASLSDHELLRGLTQLVAHDRQTTVALLMHLGEVEERKLYRPAGYPSMHAYCVRELHMSDDVTYKRLRVARLGRSYPVILEAIAAGRLHLSAVLSLSTHLSPSVVDELVGAATHKTRDEVDLMLARRFPRPDVPNAVRALPPTVACATPPTETQCALAAQLAPGRVIFTEAEQLPKALATGAALVPTPISAAQPLQAPMQLPTPLQAPAPLPAPPQRPRVTPLSPERFALQLTMDQETHDKLRYAQALLGHAVPSGDLAQVLGRALDALIDVLEKRKLGRGARTRRAGTRGKSNERYIPAAVRWQVWQRDGGQCTFTSDKGHRCESRTRLEFDHIDLFARGGGHATASDPRLRCQAHNQYEAERVFGKAFMRHKRERARRERGRSREASRASATSATPGHGLVREQGPGIAYAPSRREHRGLISGTRNHDNQRRRARLISD